MENITAVESGFKEFMESNRLFPEEHLSVCLISSVYRQGSGKAATRHCMAQGVPRTDNNSALGIQILHLGF